MKSFVLSLVKGRRSAFASLAVLFLFSNTGILQAQVGPGGRPYWWDSRGAVLAPEPVAGQGNNAAVAAAGQAMHMVKKAREAMMLAYGTRFASGQYGVGADIDSLINGFRLLDKNGTLKNRALRLGQLKYLAAPFWKRLDEFGALEPVKQTDVPQNPNRPYPWLKGNANDNALVTVGQLKMAFSFPVGPAKVTYQNVLHCGLPEVTGKAESAYVWENFEALPPGRTTSEGKAGSSARWWQTGKIGPGSGQTGEIPRNSLQEKSAPYGNITNFDNTPINLPGGFVRLAPVPDISSPLSSLELAFGLPSGPDYPEHLYIQYRWRAYPDIATGAGSLNMTLAELEKRPGLLVFGERQETGITSSPAQAGAGPAKWVPWNAFGWERFPMLIDRRRSVSNVTEYVGAFDAAVPMLTKDYSDPQFPGSNFGLLPDENSDGIFSVLSRAALPLGFPQVNGPGWRTTTIRIHLGALTKEEKEDSMDIWLDGRALGRDYGQPVEFKSKRLRSPFLNKELQIKADFQSSGHLLGLRWNGLRGADFDLGAIYVGSTNPLFPDEDNDGIAPADGIKNPRNLDSLYYHARDTGEWLETLRTGGLKSWFDETPDLRNGNSGLLSESSKHSDRDTHDGRDYEDENDKWIYQWSRSEPSFGGGSGVRIVPYFKLDIARYLQSWKYAEQTLPPPFTGEGGLKNRNLLHLRFPLDSWTEDIDADNDGLPDNWEARWFAGSLSQLPGGDFDLDGMSNLDEYRMGQNPSVKLTNKDVDQDGLDNIWELANGYNPWDGVDQSNEDPDRDGWSNAEEQKNQTDPLAANTPPKTPNPNVVTGPPRGVSFDPNLPVYPEPPSTSGKDLSRWMPGYSSDPEHDDNLRPEADADGDGVPNTVDAVPYDINLAFPRAPEAQYIAIPLTKKDGTTPETGVPVAINNLGHVLLVPPPPNGAACWNDLKGIAPSVETPDPRAPRLWKKVGQDSVEVMMPPMGEKSTYPDFTAHWDHTGAMDSRTLDLDLARDSDLVLAHALWNSKDPNLTLPDKTEDVKRIPNLVGRHAFVWDGAAVDAATAARWLPWTPPEKVADSIVSQFLAAQGSPDYADCPDSVAGRILQDGRVTGAKLSRKQHREFKTKDSQGSSSTDSDEQFDFFAWNTLPEPTALFMDVVQGQRSYTPPTGEQKTWELPFLRGPTRSLKTVHWNHHAIIQDLKGGQPGRDDPDEYSDPESASERKKEAKERRKGTARTTGYSWYYLDDLWKPSGQYLLPVKTGSNAGPQEMNNFPPKPAATKDNQGQPFTTGPLIIGPPGRYWTRDAQDETKFVSDWLYHSPGIEKLDAEGNIKYSEQDRIPFEIGPTAKINNQGVIICENRLWRNGAGHNIKDLISTSGTSTADSLSEFELHDINDSGVIAATAKKSGQRIPVMLVPVEIVPDYNRDGKIDLADSSTRRTASEPYRFWVNDDRDSDTLSEDEEADMEVAKNSDSNDEVLDSYRDLIDWFPLYLDIDEAVKALPPASYDYLIRHEDEAVSFIPCSFLKAHTDDPASRTDAYLTNATAVFPIVQKSQGDGPPPSRPPSNGIALVNWPSKATVNGVKLPPEWVAGILPDKKTQVLLIEGRKQTNRSLKLDIVRKSDSKKLTIEFPLKIASVKSMYRWENLRGVLGEGISDPENLEEPPNWPDSLCSQKSFIFVHGYSVSQESARAWAGEIFKRMFFAGSKAKFYAITWRGNQGQLSPWVPKLGGLTTDYWLNVYNAFMSSPALAAKVNAINGQKYIAAHSLGNMVTSSAIVDHGMQVDKYFMLNAAVPGEAYDPKARDEQDQQTKMTRTAWRASSGIPQDTLSANYGDLFLNTSDNRRFITWKGRFAGIQNVYQFYSSGENTLEPNRDGKEPELVADVMLKGVRTWVGGEMKKGTLTQAFGQVFSGEPEGDYTWSSGWKSRRGGWLFNRSTWPAPGMPTTLAQKKTTPLFKSFNEAPNGQSPHGAQGSTLLANPHTAGTPGYQYLAALLAQDVPSLSWPAGSYPVKVFEGEQMDLQDLAANGWDPQRKVFKVEDLVPGREGRGRWFHSDLKDICYFYNYKLFNKIVERGNLKK